MSCGQVLISRDVLQKRTAIACSVHFTLVMFGPAVGQTLCVVSGVVHFAFTIDKYTGFPVYLSMFCVFVYGVYKSL